MVKKCEVQFRIECSFRHDVFCENIMSNKRLRCIFTLL